MYKTRYICARQGTFAQCSVIWERRQGSIGSLWSADTATPKSEPLTEYCQALMQYCNTVKPNLWCNNVTLQTAILPKYKPILRYNTSTCEHWDCAVGQHSHTKAPPSHHHIIIIIITVNFCRPKLMTKEKFQSTDDVDNVYNIDPTTAALMRGHSM